MPLKRLLCALVLSACPPPPSTTIDAGAIDAGSMVEPQNDAGTTTRAPFDAGTRPDGPTPGELTYWQLDLPPGPLARTGEAGILVGADGTLVLIDVGNSNHDDDVIAAVRELNTQWLTTARGYARARGELEVDWVLLTHFHADHIAAFDALASQLTITRGVVHRGFVDVGPGTNESDFSAVCNQLRGALASKNFSLCTASPESACTISARAAAMGCPGLTRGDLSRTDDDASGDPSFIDLGSGARLEILGVNGFMLQGRTPVASTPFGVTDVNEENARSLVVLVRHGAFRYLHAGDLSGSGLSTEPDLESFVVNSAPLVFADGGIDVTHANHHARKTSSNANWIAASAPSDGKTRNVLAGINAAYVNSPHQETLDAWTNGTRLGGGTVVMTHRAPLGGTVTAMTDVNGRAVLQTVQGGDGYWLASKAFEAVRR
ncbi:MAG: MBL fold metallo-hydrolase [Archangium sp.]